MRGIEDEAGNMDAIEQIDEIEAIEIELLLRGIYQRYGYDFRNYASASIRRRILNFAKNEGLLTISSVQEKVLHDATTMDRFVLSLTVNVTAMFRDPEFFRAIRKNVVPLPENLSVNSDLGCRLLHRRRGLLNGHHASRGRHLRQVSNLRH